MSSPREGMETRSKMKTRDMVKLRSHEEEDKLGSWEAEENSTKRE